MGGALSVSPAGEVETSTGRGLGQVSVSEDTDPHPSETPVRQSGRRSRSLERRRRTGPRVGTERT